MRYGPRNDLVAITGANGFIGKKLCSALEVQGFRVRRILRKGGHLKTDVSVGEIGLTTDWSKALNGVDCVIHTAAKAHVLQARAYDAIAEFRQVNSTGTRRLADQAAARGVRRLVFISTIGVLGNHTDDRQPFDNRSVAAPVSDYAVSKWEAEQAIAEVSKISGMETVIVRPPLVYGQDAPGNFGRLIRLIERGFPLPFGLVENRRSLISLDNLVDLLVRCIHHPSAAGQTFLVSDGHDISIPDLIRGVAGAMGRKPRLLPIPLTLLRCGGRCMGKLHEIEKLIGSLQVNIQHTREILSWSPMISVEEGLRRAVRLL